MAPDMKRIVLASRPEGKPVAANFRLESAPLRALAEGEVLVETHFLSLDPYMRGRMNAGKSYAKAVDIGETMTAGAVGRVIASRAPAFAVGDYAMGMIGWASHGIVPATELHKVDPGLAPISTSLGVLGMPGFTGWHGLTAIGKPQSGETLVVAAATGPVGSMVGQLAKAHGLRVVGVAGGADKCAYAVDVLGFDACLDHYEAADASALRARLAEACPAGIDIYFENVGAKVLEAVLPLMNVGGRIPVCGMIGWYDLTPETMGTADLLPLAWRSILVNRLTVQGFIIFDHWASYGTFVQDTAPLIAKGQITYREDIAEGLEAAPQAFMDMLSGGNFGKQLVRLIA